MNAKGTFEIKLEPQQDELAPAGRMIMDKVYSGDLVGRGVGQMISKRTEGGAAVYSAIEEFEGTLQGKTGAFTLFHRGMMSATEMSLEILIVAGSGSGDLAGISGNLVIIQDDGLHRYELEYQL